MNDTMDFDENASRRAEAMYLTPDMAGVRCRTIEALGLAAGARVLDLGSGPGLFAEEMARMVGPTGCVRGVDLSESMVAISRARCADSPQVDFQIGDAVSLPFGDGGFRRLRERADARVRGGRGCGLERASPCLAARRAPRDRRCRLGRDGVEL